MNSHSQLLRMLNSIRRGDFRPEYFLSLNEALRRAHDDTDSNEYERYKTEKTMGKLSQFLQAVNTNQLR